MPPAVRCAGRQGAFHSLPVGGGEHGNNAGQQDCGGHGEPAQSLLAKTNSLHPDGQEYPYWHLALSRGMENTLGLSLKGRFAFWVVKACWDLGTPTPGNDPRVPPSLRG